MNTFAARLLLFVCGLACMLASPFVGIVVMAPGVALMFAAAILEIRNFRIENDNAFDLPIGGYAMTAMAVVAVAVVAVAGIVTVDAGERGVVVSSPAGNIGEVIDEGWHFDPKYAVCSIDKIRVNKQIGRAHV